MFGIMDGKEIKSASDADHLRWQFRSGFRYLRERLRVANSKLAAA
jgi:hypothetical protein